MNQQKLLKKSALTIAVALLSSNTFATGFYLNEYAATGLGRAFSGEGAIADNAAVGSRNPAAMMMFDRPAFSAGVTFINPDIGLSGTSPTGNSLTAKNIAPIAWVPNLHYIHPINEQWAVGGSITTNFGLSTHFPSNYPAGPLAGKTSLVTSNLNLSGAYRLDQHFSFGLGLNAVYAKAEITRHAGESAAKIPGLQSSSTIANLDGHQWGYGWNAGILYEVDDDSRFALTYRSKVNINFKGKYRSDISSALNAIQLDTGLPWGANGQKIPGSLTLNLPDIWELSAYQKVAPQWAVHYGMAYTLWSRFKNLNATNSGDQLFYKAENFRNVYRIALGTTYSHDTHWTFRSGIAFDQTPISKKYRSISIPDQNRIWLSTGTTYAFDKKTSVDLGVSYMHGQKVTIEEEGYTFKAKGKAWLYGANFNYTF